MFCKTHDYFILRDRNKIMWEKGEYLLLHNESKWRHRRTNCLDGTLLGKMRKFCFNSILKKIKAPLQILNHLHIWFSIKKPEFIQCAKEIVESANDDKCVYKAIWMEALTFLLRVFLFTTQHYRSEISLLLILLNAYDKTSIPELWAFQTKILGEDIDGMWN